MSFQSTKINPFIVDMQRSIQCKPFFTISNSVSILTKTVTLEERVPELDSIKLILRRVRFPLSDLVRWECVIDSQHRGLLPRFPGVFVTPDDAVLGAYTYYRELETYYATWRFISRCACCRVDWDQEESDEEECSED
jgi:hypothetical protein